MNKLRASGFLLAALVLILTGVQRTNLATANPDPDIGYFPIEPDTTPPPITVQSPTQNQACNSTSVWLNFTVTKPESWFRRMAPDDQQPNEWDIYVVSGRIMSAYYCLDGAEKQSIPVNYSANLEHGVLSELSKTLSFSVNLSLPEGLHNITVGVEGESCYANPYVYAVRHNTTKVYGTSETATFTVAEPPPPEPTTTFPTEIVAAASGASAIAISAGLLIYFRKFKKRE